MKTRAEDQRTAIQEALEMIAKGRPQDAAETLSAAPEAPTLSERDAALNEVLGIVHRLLEWQGPTPVGDAIRALQSAPAQVVSKADVREALLASAQRARNVAERAEVDMLAERLGLDLDAAPARCNACGHAFHDDNACSACRPGECIRSDS
jgi:predicted Zn-ribbon and HTH transcriptional regulator